MWKVGTLLSSGFRNGGLYLTTNVRTKIPELLPAIPMIRVINLLRFRYKRIFEEFTRTDATTSQSLISIS